MIKFSLKRIKELSERLALQKFNNDGTSKEETEYWLESHSELILSSAKKVDRTNEIIDLRIHKHFSN